MPYERPELPFWSGLKMGTLCEETLIQWFPNHHYRIEHLYGPGSSMNLLRVPLINPDAMELPSLIPTPTVLPLLGDRRMLVQSDHGDIARPKGLSAPFQAALQAVLGANRHIGPVRIRPQKRLAAQRPETNGS
jgi:hypothetical protein